MRRKLNPTFKLVQPLPRLRVPLAASVVINPEAVGRSSAKPGGARSAIKMNDEKVISFPAPAIPTTQTGGPPAPAQDREH